MLGLMLILVCKRGLRGRCVTALDGSTPWLGTGGLVSLRPGWGANFTSHHVCKSSMNVNHNIMILWINRLCDRGARTWFVLWPQPPKPFTFRWVNTRLNSSALAMELHLSCTNTSIYFIYMGVARYFISHIYILFQPVFFFSNIYS